MIGRVRGYLKQSLTNFRVWRKLVELNRKLIKKDRLIAKYRTLIEVNSTIASSLDKKRVLKNILEKTRDLMECEKVSILLVDEERDELRFGILTSEKDRVLLDDMRLKKGEGIAGTVWAEGRPLIINDVRRDERFSAKADDRCDSITRALIACPLRVNDRIIGVIEAVNKKNHRGFNKFDLEIFSHVTIQAAIALENAKLYEMAITDGLTRLFIHRFFQQRLEEEYNKAKRKVDSLSIVMFDIDHFKDINDSFGHQAGDMVLETVSRIIKRNCRISDIPCRYGGEEICVILTSTHEDGAYRFAEKVRKMVEAAEIEYNARTIKVTISGGVATFEEGLPSNRRELIKMADTALYRSKERGRNRISIC